MEKAPDTKIANTLFANNPFAPKQEPISNPYERDKYLGENNK